MLAIQLRDSKFNSCTEDDACTGISGETGIPSSRESAIAIGNRRRVVALISDSNMGHNSVIRGDLRVTAAITYFLSRSLE